MAIYNGGLNIIAQDISGKEDKSNKVTAWSSTTTDAHYPSEKLVKGALDGKANEVHNHTKSDITDFPTLAAVATSGNYNDLSNKPPYIENMLHTADLDYLVSSGFYRIQNSQPNSPGDWGQLLVVHGGGDTIGQLYFQPTNGEVYARSGNPPQVGGTGGWTGWHRLWKEGDAVTGAVFN